jgi:hypothetical protein
MATMDNRPKPRPQRKLIEPSLITPTPTTPEIKDALPSIQENADEGKADQITDQRDETGRTSEESDEDVCIHIFTYFVANDI